MDMDPQFLVTSESELAALHGPPLERSVRKQLDHLDDHCRAFIAASPFCVVSTQGHGMADASPRGDAPGFVKVLDDRTVLLPDRRGNNRLDNLHNLIANPAIGLLFLIPGIDETFRINGTAQLSRDPALTSQFEVQGKTPKIVVVIHVLEAYVHCSRALVRSDLWNPAKLAGPDRRIPPGALVPTFGTMLEAHTAGFVEANAVDEDAKVRVPATLY